MQTGAMASGQTGECVTDLVAVGLRCELEFVTGRFRVGVERCVTYLGHPFKSGAAIAKAVPLTVDIARGHHG